MKDLDAPPSTDGRIRRPGAGRKRLLELDPELEAALDALIDPDVRDDPRVAPALDLQERIGPRDRHPRSANYAARNTVRPPVQSGPGQCGPSRACRKPISELDPRFATWGLESRLPLQPAFCPRS